MSRLEEEVRVLHRGSLGVPWGKWGVLTVVLHFDAIEGLGLGIKNQESRFLRVLSDLRAGGLAWAKSGALFHHHDSWCGTTEPTWD